MADQDDEMSGLQRDYANTGPQTQRSETTTIGGPTESASDIKQKVTDDVHAASGFAKEKIGSVAHKAKNLADEQTGYVAHKVGSVASAMEKVAIELENGDDPSLGRLARNVGSTVRKLSDDMQGRSIGEVSAMAEDFGRKQPLAFLGLAAIAGLAASRFLTASAPAARLNEASTTKVDEPATTGTTREGYSNG